MSRISLALAATILLMSCKDDDKDTVFSGSSKLAASSVSVPPSLPALTIASAKAVLPNLALAPSTQTNLRSLLLQSSGQEDESDPTTSEEAEDTATGEAGADESDAWDTCFEDQVADVKLKASGDTITYDTTVDVGSCLAASYKADGATEVKIEKATYAIYFEATCTGGNYSSVDGKTTKEAEAIIADECNSTVGNLSSTTFTLKGSVKVGTVEYKFDSVNTSATSKADGTACTETLANGVRTSDGCVEVYKNIDAINPELNSFQKTTSSNLTWNEANPGVYYASGSLAFVVNTWSGTLTFTSATTPPTYTITDGTTTDSGTLED